jgi:hypothetical protein
VRNWQFAAQHQVLLNMEKTEVVLEIALVTFWR